MATPMPPPDRTPDLRVLAAMREAGADLTKPAHTLHYLYFNSKTSADSAATELFQLGYTNTRVARSRAPSLWTRLFGPHQFSCIAESHAIPSEPNVFATTDQLSALAERHNGEYDGWEASIEK